MALEVRFDNPRIHKVGDILVPRGHPLRVVGGAVRNLLAARPPKDFDFGTPALAEEVLRYAEEDGYRVVPTGLKHGTVTVVVEGENMEVTTLRRDVSTDGRHAEVEYITDFETDAARRDFTMNALSATLDGTVYDYFGGVDDLRAGRVRFVGDAAARIEEDYLRILRMYRFRTAFGVGSPDPSAEAAIRELHPGLNRISGERIWQEVSRILPDPNGAREIRLMASSGVLGTIGMGAATAVSLAEMEYVRLNGGMAPELLGVLLRDEAEVEAALGRFRTSVIEAKRAVLASRVARDGATSAHRWMGFVADALAGGGSDFKASVPEVVACVLAGTGREEAAAAVRSGVPRFPLKGEDLRALGMPQGPGIGALMGELRQAWKDSGFALTADDLLETAAERLAEETPRP